MPHQGNPSESAFGQLLRTHSKTCAIAYQMQSGLANAVRAKPLIVATKFGLHEMGIALTVGREIIGFLQSGPALLSTPTPALFESVVREISQTGARIDRAQLESAYFATPVVPIEQMRALLTILRMFAAHLVMVCNQIVLQETNSEPAVISAARDLIQRNIREKLSLGEVAQGVHASKFYFCRLFHDVTGQRFTAYVSALRIEKAKQLLHNPQYRVNEVAFEVGFQSMTQFNRRFKEIVGESPTNYRSRFRVDAERYGALPYKTRGRFKVQSWSISYRGGRERGDSTVTRSPQYISKHIDGELRPRIEMR